MRGNTAFMVDVPFLSWLSSRDCLAFSKAELVPDADRRSPPADRLPEVVE